MWKLTFLSTSWALPVWKLTNSGLYDLRISTCPFKTQIKIRAKRNHRSTSKILASSQISEKDFEMLKFWILYIIKLWIWTVIVIGKTHKSICEEEAQKGDMKETVIAGRSPMSIFNIIPYRLNCESVEIDIGVCCSTSLGYPRKIFTSFPYLIF